jgi:hypothetical protein
VGDIPHRLGQRGVEGVGQSSVTSPMLDVVSLCLRLRATSLRRKLSLATAACTRSAVASATPGSPFTTRETVFRLTPAEAATSFIVGRAASRLAERRCVVIVVAGNRTMTPLSSTPR